MTETDPRFHEAAAFFTLFARSPWRSCHVTAAGVEIFITRDAGEADPMRGEAAAVAPTTPLHAPHLGTVAALAGIGTVVAPGEVYGRLELLGEEVALTAAQGGVVASHLLPIGALAEYDQPLLALN